MSGEGAAAAARDLLIVVDVGNTNTVVGAFDLDNGRAGKLRGHWRLETRARRTSDEYAATLHELFTLAGLPWQIEGGMVATVVPPALFAVEKLFEEHLKTRPLVVGPGLKTGMPILYDNPREVGADRVVNAVAAFARFRRGLIVVDFGTATTFDAVSPRGEYLGGAIAPGVSISMEALFRNASKLPRVEFARPPHVVGKNTVASMQSGLVYGYVGLVDGICERMQAELSFPALVVATGGLAPLVAGLSKAIVEVDEHLTLDGLRIIHEMNA